MCKSWKLTDRLETSNSIWKPKEINKKNGILVTSLGVEKNNKMLKVISLYMFFFIYFTQINLSAIKNTLVSIVNK